MTPTQTQTVAALLGVDLSTVESDRLIELCILHRSNPKALETFPTALKSELERRFDDAAIRADDVSFAVLEKFSNEFQSAIPFFAIKLREMAATVNRDIWFTDNEAVFKSGLNDADVAAWIAKDADILTKILRNDVALPWVAQSATASKAILTRAESLAIWKDTPKLWQVWPQHAAGMGVIAQSGELTQYVIDTPAAMSAAVNSAAAVKALTTSALALEKIFASDAATKALAGSAVAVTALGENASSADAFAANEKAMQTMAASSDIMKIIINSDTWRAAFIKANDRFQSVREALLAMVKANNWRKAYQGHGVPGNWGSYNQYLADKGKGLVFATLGYYNGQTTQKISLNHPDGTLAATNGGINQPSSFTRNDGVSFDRATVAQFENNSYGYAYAEIWVPQ